jgi:hypothetical protein
MVDIISKREDFVMKYSERKKLDVQLEQGEGSNEKMASV